MQKKETRPTSYTIRKNKLKNGLKTKVRFKTLNCYKKALAIHSPILLLVVFFPGTYPWARKTK